VILHKWLPAFGVICALAYFCLALPAAAAPADKNGPKLSSDAIILTLQKETAIAVSYYTLKAYVKEGPTDIASCTVLR
jgi:hypothetical protein